MVSNGGRESVLSRVGASGPGLVEAPAVFACDGVDADAREERRGVDLIVETDMGELWHWLTPCPVHFAR